MLPLPPVIVIGIDHFGQRRRPAKRLDGMPFGNLRPGFRRTARRQLVKDMRGTICRQVLIIVVIDLEHRCAGAIAHAFDLGQRKQAVRRGVTLGHAARLASRQDGVAAAQPARRGAAYLDMPFTGSKPAAEQRQNVFFVGDDHAVLPRVEPVYRALAKQLLPIGRIGQASAIKLSFNLLIANLNQAMIESLELARRSGIDPAAWFNALDYNVAKSGLADLKKPKLLSGDFSPQFSIKHMHKDLRLALRHAASVGLRLDETAAVERAYAAAADQGLGELDFSALLKVVREAN